MQSQKEEEEKPKMKEKNEAVITETMTMDDKKEEAEAEALNDNDQDEAKNDNNDNKKKRRRGGSRKPFANLKRKKKEMIKNHQVTFKGRWREENNGTTSWEDKPPHEGSFAHPDMQKAFGIVVPEPPTTNEKTKKRKVAMLVGYLGSNYSGFQVNPGQKTLQAEMEFMLYKAGLVAKSNFGFPHKYGWSTSGRTDKGVHACAQVCSCKIETTDDTTTDDIRERLNQNRDDHDIEVLDVKMTTRNFCAKTQRSRVRYQYMIPSFVLQDADTVRSWFHGMHGGSPHDPLSNEQVQRLRQLPAIRNYRVSPEQLERLKRALQKYVGTHPYHNFTKGMHAGDKSSFRYIESFEVQEPVLLDNDGMEWIPTLVLGQAFLLNQIRKMVALATDVTRMGDNEDVDLFQVALSPSEKMKLPIAPAQGLFLDMSVYEGYNQRRQRSQHANQVDELDWIHQDEKTSPTLQRWKAFKQTIWKRIAQEEETQGNFLKYLYIQEFVFDGYDRHVKNNN